MFPQLGSLIVLAVVCGFVGSQVIELDDSFREKREDKPWLLMFYAPWCGHCKKLEPVYHHVYLKLKDTEPNIRVAKVDATRYQSLASEYEVRGYPTIKFIQGDRSFTHTGDRSKEGIIEFARRAKGPSVRPLTNMGKFNEFRSDHSDQVFFFFVGIEDSFNDLYKKFSNLSSKYAVLTYFAAGEKRVLPADIRVKNDPSVIVFKDATHYEYQPSAEDGATFESLEAFINNERFQAFPKIAGGALNEFSELKKKVVILVVDDKERDKKAEHDRFKDVGQTLATKERNTYGKEFQFIWMGEKETIDAVTMMDVVAPFVVVLDPATQHYYLPEFKMTDMTVDLLKGFLDDVQSGKSPTFGGTGFSQRLKRVFYDIYTTIFRFTGAGWIFSIKKFFWDLYLSFNQIYDESPWLALLVFGVPSLVISIVCYALCCMEPMDDDVLYGEEDEEEYDDEPEGVPETKALKGKDRHIKKE